jgi:hypothetical protein
MDCRLSGCLNSEDKTSSWPSLWEYQILPETEFASEIRPTISTRQTHEGLCLCGSKCSSDVMIQPPISRVPLQPDVCGLHIVQHDGEIILEGDHVRVWEVAAVICSNTVKTIECTLPRIVWTVWVRKQNAGKTAEIPWTKSERGAHRTQGQGDTVALNITAYWYKASQLRNNYVRYRDWSFDAVFCLESFAL